MDYLNYLNFFEQYLLHFIILYISLALIYIFYTHTKSVTKNLPLGKKGFPFIGETISYVMSAREGKPEKFITDRTSKYSKDIFRSSLLGEDMAVFCGAAGNKFLFSGQNKYVTSWWPHSIKKALMDPSCINNSSLEESTKLRSFLPPFLKPESLQHYIPIMDLMAIDHLEKEWSPYKEVKVFPLSKKYTFALACRLFISIVDSEHVEKFAEPFALATAGLISVPIDFLGTTFNRACKAGKVIREKFKEIISKRKLELEVDKNSGNMDLLTSMLLEGLNEVEISNKIVGFFIASHDTTSTAITFIIKYLAEYPKVYDRVLKGN